MMTTKIEWTDEVWNPVTGCTKVSQGCKNCYAERIANRFWGDRKFTDVICHPERLEIPLHWRKPRRVFVNSMSDLFHLDVPFGFVSSVWSVMRKTPQHTYQILTKRPKWMFKFITEYLPQPPFYKLPENVWLGVSVENQATADERIPILLQTPAAVRFISYEPALGPVDFWKATGHADGSFWHAPKFSWFNDSGLDWIIAGGESGPGARPAHPDWFRSVRDQCVEAGIPYFLKQMVVNGKMVKMPELDGRVWNEYPEVR